VCKCACACLWLHADVVCGCVHARCHLPPLPGHDGAAVTPDGHRGPSSQVVSAPRTGRRCARCTAGTGLRARPTHATPPQNCRTLAAPSCAANRRQQSQGLLPPGTAFDLFRGTAASARDEVETYPTSLAAKVVFGAKTHPEVRAAGLVVGELVARVQVQLWWRPASHCVSVPRPVDVLRCRWLCSRQTARCW
jgi:hypothetical protein